MRFLADENFPLASVDHLRKLGYDITSVGIEYAGISDLAVLEIAALESRTILTFDKDFGEMIFKHNKKPGNGIIYFRLQEFTPDEPGQLLEMVLSSNDFNPENALTVIDRSVIRQKRF